MNRISNSTKPLTGRSTASVSGEIQERRRTGSTEEIWREFSVQLHRFILKNVRDPHDADDILQDSFVKIHAHIRDLQDDTRLESWIYQIVRHAIADYFRSLRPSVDIDEIPLASEPEEDEKILSELGPCLKPMLNALPEPYRGALLMTTDEGLNQKQLAEKLGISPSGARSQVQRAREKLKEILLDCCHFDFDRRGSVTDYQPRPDCCPRCAAGRQDCAPSCEV
jgi:RNA polymerase sigma-70 factor, ECF subfamily